jgi:Skp family chaperone for outer membrane proteins
MTSDPAVTNPTKSPLAAIALKLVGLVTIISALLDYLVLIIPPNFANPQWQLATTTQLVDRGIVPLVGIALILTGFWIDSSVGRSRLPQSLATDLRFWVCALASLLGLMYLLLALFHVNAVRLNSRTALEQVSSEASQASSQLEQQLSSELNQQQNQLGALLQNDALLSQAIQSGQLPQEIEQFRDDPEGLTQFLQQRADQTRQEIQTQIGTRREEAERRVRTEAWKSGIRVSISSLLLAVGYIIIGWSGLKRLMALSQP